MRLLKSISRGTRDGSLLFRTNISAVVIVAVLAVACTGAGLLIADDLVTSMRAAFVVAFLHAMLLTWWLGCNRRFALDVKTLIFKRGNAKSTEEGRRSWYATAEQWIRSNRLSIGEANLWLWPTNTARAFETLERALNRRANGRDHAELLLYTTFSAEQLSEMRKVMDEREELPGWFDAGIDMEGFATRWAVLVFLFYCALTLLFGLPPVAQARLPPTNGSIHVSADPQP